MDTLNGIIPEYLGDPPEPKPEGSLTDTLASGAQSLLSLINPLTPVASGAGYITGSSDTTTTSGKSRIRYFRDDAGYIFARNPAGQWTLVLNPDGSASRKKFDSKINAKFDQYLRRDEKFDEITESDVNKARKAGSRGQTGKTKTPTTSIGIRPVKSESKTTAESKVTSAPDPNSSTTTTASTDVFSQYKVPILVGAVGVAALVALWYATSPETKESGKQKALDTWDKTKAYAKDRYEDAQRYVSERVARDPEEDTGLSVYTDSSGNELMGAPAYGRVSPRRR